MLELFHMYIYCGFLFALMLMAQISVAPQAVDVLLDQIERDCGMRPSLGFLLLITALLWPYALVASAKANK